MNPIVRYSLLGAGFVATFAAGAYTGFLVTRKKIEAECDKQIEYEVELAKKGIQQMYKAGAYSTPKDTQEAFNEKIDTQMEIVVDQAVLMSEEIITQQGYSGEEVDKDFAPDDEDDDHGVILENPYVYEEELASRTPDAPYIITSDEFFENETEFNQVSMTYFEGDDTLIDSVDSVVPNSNKLVGDNNLLRFGHGSDQEHTVYVRNEKMELEIEVNRSTGSYSEEVLGLKHSDYDVRRKVRKFRGDDE